MTKQTAREGTHQPFKTASMSVSPRARECDLWAFTLVELLVVLAIIGVLAGLTVKLAGVASRQRIESRARAELAKLVTLIADYHAVKGHYPPDHPALNPTAAGFTFYTNSLYYELSRTNGAAGDLVDEPLAQAAFGVGGILNLPALDGESGVVRHHFKDAEFKVITVRAGGRSRPVAILGVTAPSPIRNAPGLEGFCPWQYRLGGSQRAGEHPPRNPASYDLWLEYEFGGKRYVVGNW